MNVALDRRAFVRSLSAPFWASLLPASALRRAVWLPRGDARTLVVLELQGGNDGLNTVVPVDDAAYAQARPTLAQVRHGALPLGNGFALHGALAAVAARVGGGSAAIVHGVGYDPPDRSHFRSRDIWHTADPAHDRVRQDTTGWLGRAADWLASKGAGLPAAALGGVEVPLVLKTRTVVVPSLERAEDFALRTVDGSAQRALAELPGDGGAVAAGDGSPLAFAAATAAAAVAQAESLRTGLQRYRAQADYPDGDFAGALQLCARVAVAGFGTRLFHVALGGFDTHAQQLATHDGLLRQLDRALGALLLDLDGHGKLQDTVVFVHSEFGRRVRENQSLGTDHGAAAPVLLLGGDVRAGLHGTAPDLDKLVDGDVPPTTDFRAVYGSLLRWLGIDAAAVLGAQAPAPLDLLPA